jgi:hypothetical protein
MNCYITVFQRGRIAAREQVEELKKTGLNFGPARFLFGRACSDFSDTSH